MSSEVTAMSSKMAVPAAPVTVAITITVSTDRVTTAATAAHPYALAVTPPPATPSTIAVPAIYPAVPAMMPTPTSAPVSSTVAHSHAAAAAAVSHAPAMTAVLHGNDKTPLVGLGSSLRPTAQWRCGGRTERQRGSNHSRKDGAGSDETHGV